ncbi:MAG TPA: C40 family peptidase [Thermoanaerobaculia bacterium]
MIKRLLPILLLAAVPLLAQPAPERYVVAVPVADMHKAPSADAEVVSQAMFSSPVVALEREDDWVKIRTTIDDYTGWVRAWTLTKEDAGAPYRSGRTAIVTSLFANLYREPNIETHRPVTTIPFEARLPVVGETTRDKVLYYEVRLPDGTSAFVQAGDVAFEPKPLTIDEAIALGKRFLGLPYLWGGTTSRGYDCSGYTQMLMRQRGYMIPRDSSVQARWEGSATVDRADLQPGDLLYFGRPAEKKVNHTGMYIGGGEFIHCTRVGRPSVQIGTLDDPHWSDSFVTARRVK